MPEVKKRPTAVDVARASGVSTATVSYVLNQAPGQRIPPATRDRVLAAAEALGYVPSADAQALARGRSRIVIIDLSEIPHGETIARFGRDVAAALDARGYLPVVDQPERSSGASHRRLLDPAALLAPAIVVTVTPLPEHIRRRLTAAGVERLVALLPGDDEFAERIAAAAHAQIAHLAERGHRMLAYCGTDEEHLEVTDALRRAAVIDAAAQRQLPLLDLGPHRSPATIQDALGAALAAHPELSAVAAYNDEVAVTTLSAAHRLGLAIPAQLAVIGVDDTPLASIAFPALTSVKTSDTVGHAAAEFIERILAGEEPTYDIVTDVVHREST